MEAMPQNKSGIKGFFSNLFKPFTEAGKSARMVIKGFVASSTGSDILEEKLKNMPESEREQNLINNMYYENGNTQKSRETAEKSDSLSDRLKVGKPKKNNSKSIELVNETEMSKDERL